MTARWDRRWPPPWVAAPLHAKYRDVRGIGGHTHAELTCEYYDRTVRLRYTIHVGSWQSIRPLAKDRWIDHGPVPARTPVVALGFGLIDRCPTYLYQRTYQARIEATIALISPATGEQVAVHLPLGGIMLGPVGPGWPRPWRNWIHDPDWGRLYHPDLRRV